MKQTPKPAPAQPMVTRCRGGCGRDVVQPADGRRWALCWACDDHDEWVRRNEDPADTVGADMLDPPDYYYEPGDAPW